MYDNYVSLGNNCESAFQIRRILGKDSSGFFSWNVTQVDALISVLNRNFHNIINCENLEKAYDGWLVRDKEYGYSFHSPFDRLQSLGSEPDFDKKYNILKHKFDYFVEKFRNHRQFDRTALFYKTDDQEIDHRFITVRDLLYNFFPDKNFDFIVLQAESAARQTWIEPNIHIRYMKRLAPWEDATDGHVQSWDRVFREFPFSGEMHLAGFD